MKSKHELHFKHLINLFLLTNSPTSSKKILAARRTSDPEEIQRAGKTSFTAQEDHRRCFSAHKVNPRHQKIPERYTIRYSQHHKNKVTPNKPRKNAISTSLVATPNKATEDVRFTSLVKRSFSAMNDGGGGGGEVFTPN